MIINAATVAKAPGKLAMKPYGIPSRFGAPCPIAIMIGPKDAQAGNIAFESLNTCDLPFVVCVELFAESSVADFIWILVALCKRLR